MSDQAMQPANVALAENAVVNGSSRGSLVAAMRGPSALRTIALMAEVTFVEAVRHYIGAYLVVLGGCDVLAFTGGIGENAVKIRESICRCSCSG